MFVLGGLGVIHISRNSAELPFPKSLQDSICKASLINPSLVAIALPVNW